MKKPDKTLFILAFILFWNAALSPDVFYFPPEYRDPHNDSYALERELSQLQANQRNQLGNLLSVVLRLEEKVKVLHSSYSASLGKKTAELSQLNEQIAETAQNEIEAYRTFLADRKDKFAAMEAQANIFEAKLKAENSQ